MEPHIARQLVAITAAGDQEHARLTARVRALELAIRLVDQDRVFFEKWGRLPVGREGLYGG